MSKVLLVLSHPQYEDSFANKTIIENLKNKVDNIEIVHLDKEYKDMKIDIEKEQKRLMESDILILQFPLFSYSTPGLMKIWWDEVFTYGFAHGSTGDKVKDKKVIISTTAGTPTGLYSKEGVLGNDIYDFMLPITSALKFSRMILEDIVFTGSISFNKDEETLAKMTKALDLHVEKIEKIIDKNRK